MQLQVELSKLPTNYDYKVTRGCRDHNGYIQNRMLIIKLEKCWIVYKITKNGESYYNGNITPKARENSPLAMRIGTGDTDLLSDIKLAKTIQDRYDEISKIILGGVE